MELRDTIDELDALVGELSRLRQQLCLAELRGSDTAVVWEAEAELQRLARRADRRARLLRRAIELDLADDLTA